MSAVRRETVRPEEAGLRFDRWCRQRFPQLGHGALQKLLRTGQFRLDGKRVGAGDRLAAGQTVRVPPLPEAAPAAALAKPRLAPRDAAFVRGLVLHEDDDVIVLNKPAGLAVQGGTGTSRHLDLMLGAFGEGEARPRLVHRLDRDTSGLLVVARSQAVARELAFAFQQHRVRKLYWAVVVGRPQRNQGEIDLALAKQGPPGRERMHADEDGRRARTAWRVLAAAGKAGAWLALLPLTGRTHQLRAHCAALGCPIQGDGKYGGKAALPAGAPPGLMLHAREIDLPLPGGRRLKLVAEPPASFRESLRRLGIEAGQFLGDRLGDWP